MSGLGSVLFRRGFGRLKLRDYRLEFGGGAGARWGRVCLEGGLLLRFEGGRREEENGEERDER